MRCLISTTLFLLLPFSSLSGQTLPAAYQPPADPGDIQGLWIWEGPWITKSTDRTELIVFCKHLGINRLLVQPSFATASDGKPALKFPIELRSFLVDAATQRIAVEALDGAPNMASRKNWPQSLAKLDDLLEFNRSLPQEAKLAGIHYDIEPYLLKDWKESEQQRLVLMLDFLRFLNEAKRRIHQEESSLTLAADIPFWYDNKTEAGDTCVLEFNSEAKNLHQHVQDLCDYVGIMSYRRNATGRNSVGQVIENEINYAAQIGEVVVPALETIELKTDPQISFFGSSPEEFWKVHNQIRAAFDQHSGFGGMFTHSYRGMRDLYDNTSEK